MGLFFKFKKVDRKDCKLRMLHMKDGLIYIDAVDNRRNIHSVYKFTYDADTPRRELYMTGDKDIAKMIVSDFNNNFHLARYHLYKIHDRYCILDTTKYDRFDVRVVSASNFTRIAFYLSLFGIGFGFLILICFLIKIGLVYLWNLIF